MSLNYEPFNVTSYPVFFFFFFFTLEILALTFRQNLLKPLKVFPLRPEVG